MFRKNNKTYSWVIYSQQRVNIYEDGTFLCQCNYDELLAWKSQYID